MCPCLESAAHPTKFGFAFRRAVVGSNRTNRTQLSKIHMVQALSHLLSLRLQKEPSECGMDITAIAICQSILSLN